MSGAFSAQGSILKINGTEIAEVSEFGGPSISRPKVDVTHLRSTAREYIAGLQDTGSFTFTMNYIPTDPGQLALRQSLGVEQVQQFDVLLPNDPISGTPRQTWSSTTCESSSYATPFSASRSTFSVLSRSPRLLGRRTTRATATGPLSGRVPPASSRSRTACLYARASVDTTARPRQTRQYRFALGGYGTVTEIIWLPRLGLRVVR